MSLKSIHPSVTSPSPPPSFANLANRAFLAQHLCGFITPPHKATRWIYVGDRCHSHVPAPPEHPSSLSERALPATGTLRCAYFSDSVNISQSRACAEFGRCLETRTLTFLSGRLATAFRRENLRQITITVRYPRCKRRASSQNGPFWAENKISKIK